MLLDLTTIPMHPSEWASILFNLYTNAKRLLEGLNHEIMEKLTFLVEKLQIWYILNFLTMEQE